MGYVRDGPLDQISIHAFRVEGDLDPYLYQIAEEIFQSTPSVWKATPIGKEFETPKKHFNPRLPCGRRRKQQKTPASIDIISIHAFRVEGDNGTVVLYHCQKISIHAFRVEGDLFKKRMRKQDLQFQSTPSVWKATVASYSYKPSNVGISIHAFRVEGDCKS